MTEKTRAERQADLKALIELEGAELAVETAMSICRDKAAPAPAKATALTALLRAGGYLQTKPDGFAKKEPAEMSLEELQQEIDKIRRSSNDKGVFD